MKVSIPCKAVAPILISSGYTLWDVKQPIHNLGWYLISLVPMPSFLITPVLFCASIRQFSEDIGFENSIIMHMCWIVLFRWHEIGWYFFAVCYFCLHSLPRFLVWFLLKPWDAACAFVVSTVTTCCIINNRSVLVLNDFFQKLYIAHILTQFVSKEGIPALIL